jgi:hypothetical protein
LKVNLIEFISGALVPLSVFPAAVTKAFSVLPFYYTVYYPTSLLTGQSEGNPLAAAALMLFWNAVMIVISVLYYKKSVRRFEGVGMEPLKCRLKPPEGFSIFCCTHPWYHDLPVDKLKKQFFPSSLR